MLIEHAAIRADFEIRLRDPWGPAFDAFETLLVSAEEAGDEFLERHREYANRREPNGDAMFHAQTRLFFRACRVSSEILALLRSGYPRGALARWRTLHEIAVTMAFLSEQGYEVAEEYLLHEGIATHWRMVDYQRHAETLGEEPFDTETIAEIEAERARLLDRFGKPYDRPYGWAATALGDNAADFAKIEKATELSHWRPYAKWASEYVHDGPKVLGPERWLPDGREEIVAGAQDDELGQPGQNAALSLSLAAMEYLVSRPGMDELVKIAVVRELSEGAVEAFANAEEERERQASEEREDDGEDSAPR